MTKLSKEKRKRVIGTVLVTLMAVVAVWCGVVQVQRTSLKTKLTLLSETRDKLNSARRNASLAEKLKVDLAAAERKLNAMEAIMPIGDVYRWTTRTFTRLQTNKVEITQLEPPHLGDLNILPKGPYKAATFNVTGTAYYHDFGKFLANLENSFPHVRLQRLELEPTQFGEPETEEQEKLNFKIEILALVKSRDAEP
jgi:Tfp pilus assembly protein PilO